jgi:hypothetical protein
MIRRLLALSADLVHGELPAMVPLVTAAPGAETILTGSESADADSPALRVLSKEGWSSWQPGMFTLASVMTTQMFSELWYLSV